MSNLAEKLPKALQTKLNEVEGHGRKLVKQLDEWVETNVPTSVTAPLRTEDGVNLKTIRVAANAAKESLINEFKARWKVVAGGQNVEAETEEATKPASKAKAAPKTTNRKATAKSTSRKAAPKATSRKATAARATSKGKPATAQAQTVTTTRTKKTTTAKKKSNTSESAAS